MNQKQFLQTVLADGANYCLFLKKTNAKKGFNKFYENIDDLLDGAENYVDEYNVFFATATFTSSDDRLAKHSEYLNSFFLDIDSKDVGGKDEALKRVKMLCKITGLPKPLIVDSGNGMHFYWILSEQVKAEKWQPIASAFKKFCTDKRVGADPTVTADTARVLRLPESFNLKGETPKDVRVLAVNNQTISIEDFCEKIGYDEDDVLLDSSRVAGLFSDTSDRLSGNYESKFEDVIAEGNCQHLRKAVEENASLSEPHWFSALAVAKHCSDSDVYIIKLSEDHEDFNEADTYKKANTAEYPHTCETLRSHEPSWCEGCPHYGKIKSPIVLGNDVIEREVGDDGFYVEPEEPTLADSGPNFLSGVKIPKAPAGFMVGKEGGVYKIVIDEDGGKDKVLITKHTLYGVARTYDKGEGSEALVMQLHLPNDPPRRLIMPNSVVSSAEELRKSLAEKGLMTERQKELKQYVVSWIERFQEMGIAQEPVLQYGWTDTDMKEFAIGQNLYTADGVEASLPSENTAKFDPYFDPKGTLANWKKAISLWENKRFVQQQYALCAGLGSLLMERCNTNGSLVHLYSKDSGVGKTAILQAVTSAFGKPRDLILNHEDTLNSKMHRIETWHNLPPCMDEITNISADGASALVYQITNGRQKTRMESGSNSERTKGKPWSLIALSTSNTSLLSRMAAASGKMDPQAEAQRVLEIYVRPQLSADDDKLIAGAFERAIQNNYGHAGPVLVQWMAANPDVVATIHDTCMRAVDKHAKLRTENRFWSDQASCALAMSIIAKKAGLFNFDSTVLLNYIAKELIPENRKGFDEMCKTGIEIVSEFINEHHSEVLIIKDGDAPSIGGMPIPAEKSAHRQISVRLDSEKDELAISCTQFQKWCAQKQIDYKHTVKYLTVVHEAQRKKLRISTGTSLNLPSLTCVVIPKYSELDDVEALKTGANTPQPDNS